MEVHRTGAWNARQAGKAFRCSGAPRHGSDARGVAPHRARGAGDRAQGIASAVLFLPPPESILQIPAGAHAQDDVDHSGVHSSQGYITYSSCGRHDASRAADGELHELRQRVRSRPCTAEASIIPHRSEDVPEAALPANATARRATRTAVAKSPARSALTARMRKAAGVVSRRTSAPAQAIPVR